MSILFSSISLINVLTNLCAEYLQTAVFNNSHLCCFSSIDIHKASFNASATSFLSHGFTLIALLKLPKVPANSLKISGEYFSPWHVTYSCDVRFNPSLSGVIRHTSAILINAR
eukprot:NODE_575_length_6553_cov_0.185156.p5 type:complete len:113 gc:universal NODE_575_length_6553_cov_0.185156:3968-3630(-)